MPPRESLLPRLVAAALLAAAWMAAAPFSAALAQGDPEPLAELTGLPAGPVLDIVRGAVGTAEGPAPTLFEARRRAERARDRAVAALRAEGYYGARVDARVEPGEVPRARLEIAAGERFALGFIAVSLAGPPDPEAQAAAEAALGLTPGAPARAADVLAAEARVVSAVEDAGWPDVVAGEREVIVDHARHVMDVTYRIDAGRAAVFGPVRAQGSARIRADYLMTAAPFRPGDRYDREDLDLLSRRLRETGAFESVSARLDPSAGPGAGPETRPVVVEAESGPRRTITLGASYSTSEGGGVEGGWTKRNLFGGAESLTVSAAIRTIDRRIEVELAAPHFRKPGRTLRLNLGLANEETDAYDLTELAAGARIETKLSERLSGALGVGATLSRVDDGTSTEDFTLLFGSGSAAWDGADDPLDPRRGVRADISLRPTVGVGNDPLAYIVAQGGASVYRPLGDRVVAALRGRLGSVIGPALSEVPANERFFAGGGGSIRGYEYQAVSPRDADGTPVGGRSVVEVSAELRYRAPGRRLGYVAFIDGGAASEQMTPQSDELRWGAGVGLRWYTRFGPIRADVAVPLDRRDGEPSAQLYLSIGQAF
jgi:translocation and assembly module TamA